MKANKPVAIWHPGAWTPQRCAAWNRMREQGKARLERWVDAEKDAGRCHARQVPDEAKAMMEDE